MKTTHTPNYNEDIANKVALILLILIFTFAAKFAMAQTYAKELVAYSDGAAPGASETLIDTTRTDRVSNFNDSGIFPLPSEKIKLSSSCVNGNSILRWNQPNSEEGIYFGIEASTDGKIWEALDEVEFKNEGPALSYEILNHNFPQSYYRVVLHQKNGKKTTSNVISSKCRATETSVKIYPNPVVDFLQVNISTPVEESGMFYLMDNEGTIVLQQEINSGENTIYLNNGLKKGLYLTKTIFTGILSHNKIIVN